MQRVDKAYGLSRGAHTVIAEDVQPTLRSGGEGG